MEKKVYHVKNNDVVREITVLKTGENRFDVTYNGTKYAATFMHDPESGLTAIYLLGINGGTNRMEINQIKDGRYDIIFDGLEFDVTSKLISSEPVVA